MFAKIKVNGQVHEALVTEDKQFATYIYEGVFVSSSDQFEIVEEINQHPTHIWPSVYSNDPTVKSLRELIGQDIAEIKFK